MKIQVEIKIIEDESTTYTGNVELESTPSINERVSKLKQYDGLLLYDTLLGISKELVDNSNNIIVHLVNNLVNNMLKRD